MYSYHDVSMVHNVVRNWSKENFHLLNNNKEIDFQNIDLLQICSFFFTKNDKAKLKNYIFLNSYHDILMVHNVA